jgi:hypothetical protein
VSPFLFLSNFATHPDDFLPSSSYIEYPARGDADEAIRTLSNSQLKGSTVTLEDAVRRRSISLPLLLSTD